MRVTDISFFKTFNLDSTYAFEGHTHNSFEANIILSGNMEVSVDGNVIKLSQGDMLLWTPNRFHFNRIEDKKYVDLLSIHFGVEGFPINDDRVIFYHLSHEKIVLVNIMIKQVEKYGFEKRGAADSLLESILYMSIRGSKQPEYSDDSSALVYSKAMEIMNNRQDAILTIPEIAKYCGVCATTLKNAFKLHSGKTIKKYYCELKTETAKNMLVSGMKAEQVGLELGFSSISYFSQFFKKNTGMTLREFMLKYK